MRSNLTRAVLAAALALAFAPATFAEEQGTSAEADAFVKAVEAEARAIYPELTAAQWVSVTYINPDTQLLAAKANERFLSMLKRNIDASKRFDGVSLTPWTARQIKLMKLSTAMPAPADPKKLAELTAIATKLEGEYGAGKYCKDAGGKQECRDLGQLEEVLKTSRDYDAQLDAWRGWHDTARIMRGDYQRFAQLVNEGSRELGYSDTGEFWRAGYDMTPAEFARETDRLWGQVKPLYDDLQCYVRGKLEEKYGAKGSIDGMIPAHLTGNMWAQQWGNLWDILEPYPDAGGLDVEGGLKAQGYDHLKMVQRAEDFYRSLGFPALPKSFYEKSQFLQPRDRDVVCHASAWDIDLSGDVRIKMCIKPNEDDFSTIYHEMGHVYYYLAYNDLPLLFQGGAHDGFHEAIGDTIVLSMTPSYLHTIGLVGEPKQSREAVINAQLKLALDKVAFLPFGLLIDRWRWGVFDGSIKPADYNKAWWDLRAKYQGVAPAIARTENDFDPGAKYHVPGNTPYTRYFFAHVLQFQFYKALCDASGYKGPLHECSFYGNKEAGKRYWAMLQHGQSQPWPATLKELTGTEQMDATAIIDDFAPLQAWLKEQNKGKQCGW
ncbi:MAG TPA: M2 family metallopeptidase, partial [Xanthomonadales bacterium]|nr:M2 family metallopeptidase [Xanthomonadales bacterium]